MEQQVCQFQTVSTKGFTPRLCASCVPNFEIYVGSVGPHGRSGLRLPAYSVNSEL